MPKEKHQGEYIFHQGRFVRWDEAVVHIGTHALHYGSSVFEGLRVYAQAGGGQAIFRLRDHLLRLFDSARLLRIELAQQFSLEQLEAICLELVARNHSGACYLRPIVYRSAASFSLDVGSLPFSFSLLSIEWGTYLGEGALEKGVDAQVSSWRRFGSGSLAPMGKIGGQYVNNQWVSTQAKLDGYEEGIVLDAQGMVSEGGGENLFLVKNGVLFTPPLSSSILAGITRDSVVRLARADGFEVRETPIARELLYIADEIFMTGTAAEITPVRTVDRMKVGSGERGRITQRLQEIFFATVEGRRPDTFGWLEVIPALVHTA